MIERTMAIVSLSSGPVHKDRRMGIMGIMISIDQIPIIKRTVHHLSTVHGSANVAVAVIGTLTD